MFVRHRISAIAIVSVFLVSGCQSADDAPTPEAPVEPGVSDVVETVPEFVPERVEGGTARENQPHVDWVIQAARAASTTRVAGRDVVTLLEASGYLREAMELTPDSSLIELPTDSTSLAIRFGSECVVAQWGSDWFASSVEPVFTGATCLLGETVSLD